MTSISFTSGEILDIISALEERENAAYIVDNDTHLAAYYLNIINQFERIHRKLQDFVPEDRVANLILAAN